MGIIHHAAYLPYLEEARVEYLRAIGHPYDSVHAGDLTASSAHEGGRDFAVLEVSVHYRKPLRFDDEVDVALVIGAVTGTTFQIAYLLSVGGESRATAVTVHGCVDARGRPARLPAWVGELQEAELVGAFAHDLRVARALARHLGQPDRPHPGLRLRSDRPDQRRLSCPTPARLDIERLRGVAGVQRGCRAEGKDARVPAGDRPYGPHQESLVVSDREVSQDPALQADGRLRRGAPVEPSRQSTDGNCRPGPRSPRRTAGPSPPGPIRVGGVPCPRTARRRTACGSPSRHTRGSSAGRCCTGSRSRPGSRSSRHRGSDRHHVERVFHPFEKRVQVR